MKQLILSAIALLLGTTLLSVPGSAQGNGRSLANQLRERVEQSDDRYDDDEADDDEADDDDDDDDYEYDNDDDRRPGREQVEPVLRRGNGSGKVPPGWCRGIGNPHNTPENCGPGRSSDPSRNPTGNRERSYDQAHADFHWEMDRRYEAMAAERPLDIQYQLELRARKRAEHDDWHRRTGTRHD